MALALVSLPRSNLVSKEGHEEVNMSSSLMYFVDDDVSHS
jgi:hypothetical protein